MTKIKQMIIAGILLTVGGAGCATIVTGGADTVPVHTNPEGAKVYLNGQFIGKTPTSVTIPRKSDAVFRFELDGYETKTVDHGKVVNGWIFGNIIFGGIIGLAVDAISGGIYMLTPDQIQAELRSNQMAYSKQSKDSCIVVVLEPNPSWKKVGNLVCN